MKEIYMCGIVGYIGKYQAKDYLLDGLETLEYRGYDSAGIMTIENSKATCVKVVGRVEHLRKAVAELDVALSKPSALGSSPVAPIPTELEIASVKKREAQANRTKGTEKRASQVFEPEISERHTEFLTQSESRCAGSVGIGHTRWATHGGITKKNAHPHTDNDLQFYVVHNGIIENHREIRKFLKGNGFSFHSETDTEVIPNLIAFHFRKLQDVQKAFIACIKELRGAYGIVMSTPLDPETLYCAKLSSPMALGIGEGENFIGSDALPIVGRTKNIVFLEDGEIALVKKDSYELIRLKDLKNIERPAELIQIEQDASSKGDFPDYMSKEIHESPQTVRSAILGRLKTEENIIKLGGLEEVRDQLAYIDRIIIIACGTSYYAGLVGEYILEEIAGIPVEVQQASEFRYRNEPLSRSTAVLAISQSGETADTIAALKKLDGTGILKLGVVNAPGSTIARMTDAGVYCHAGPEKAVASTKAFIAQVTVLTLIALELSKNYSGFSEIVKELDSLPSKLETVLGLDKKIAKIAKNYAHHRDFLYIGRRFAYPVALEGALKLKEISYIHAEGFAGGEMKHGPLALIDENFPTFAISLSNDIDEKSASNLQEILARKGPVIALVDDKDSEAAKSATDVIVVPRVPEPLQPIVASLVTYLFAYHVARELGRDIDKPRNLAKSVTVE